MKTFSKALAVAGATMALAGAAAAQTPNTPQAASGAFVDVPGGKLWYETCGSGPKTLVLLHDGVLHSVVWEDVWPDLCKTFRVVRYDRRGYGRSPEAKTPYSPVEDVAAVMKAAGMDHAVIIGASNGGGIAVDFALAHPQQVDRLVLVGPAVTGIAGSSYGAGRQIDLLAKVAQGDYVAAIKNSWLLARDDDANVARVLKLEQASPQDMNHQDPATPSPPAAPRLSQIKVPTLVLVGEDDVADNHAQAGVVTQAIPGALRVVIPKAGHLLYMEQPAQFVRILDRFAGGDKGAPTPGAEEALRSLIGDLQSGSTAYSRVNPGLATGLRQGAEAAKRQLAALGALKSVTFQQIDVADSDVYVLAFERLRLRCHLQLDDSGRIKSLLILPAT
jgi:pimeloyl-ACP methyl ester carboxylesterase